MAEIIASVIAVTGSVFARDADGNVRALKPGDVLRQGDTVLTDQGGRVELVSAGGEPFELGEGQTLRISAEMSDDARPSSDEAELVQGSVEELMRALNEGGQIDELLEEPAAGLSGGSGGEGNNFVRLLRIVEPVTPQDYEFNRVSALEPELPLRGRDLDEPEESAPVQNSAPLAADDAITVGEDSSFTGRLPVASDADGDPVRYEAASGPAHGELVINPDGSYQYTPAPDFNGTDSFSFTVIDDRGNENTYTVTIEVTPANDPQVAADDAVTAGEDATLTGTVSLIANDSDVDGDALSAVAGTFTTAQGGTIVIAADGSYTYTPPADFTGTDTVEYTVTDGTLSDTGTLTIEVTRANDAPVAANDNAITDEDTPVDIDVLANDTDTDADSLLVTAAVADNGTVSINPDGTLRYTPDADFNGEDTITYTVRDGQGGTSTATVAVTVGAVADVMPDALVTAEDTAVTANVLTGTNGASADTFEGSPE
ncbi:MAG: retention module-containing protein, partial [Gammaproteobacteria bacterium]